MYIRLGEGGSELGLGCGRGCSCGPCRLANRGLGEWYVRDEEEEDQESETKTPQQGLPMRQAPGAGRPGLGQVPTGPGARTRDVKVVVKSFIARIGPRTGSLPARCLVLPPWTPPATARLVALAAATDLAMSENPLTDARDKRYRLFSARTFAVTCQDGRLVSIIPSALDTDVGTECIPRTRACLQPPALTISGVSGRISGPNTFEFSWTARGRPHLAAEPAFQGVCPRTSRYIWHTVSGRIDCSTGEPRVTVRLVGSQFPSHRVFVNGVAVSTVPQHGFGRLWVSAPSELTRVA